jgi:hypothetical protein
MQVNTLTKIIFSIFVTMSLISMSISWKMQINTEFESSGMNSKRKEKTTQVVETKTTTNTPTATTSLTSPTVKQSNNVKPTVPFDAENTVRLIQDIGQSIMASDDTSQQILVACTQILSQKAKHFSDFLNSFWTNMNNVATKVVPWDNKFYQEVLDKLESNTILIGNQGATCSSLKIPSNVDTTKIMDKLNQGKYFGGFNTVTPTTSFISGMVSHHRNLINDDTFLNINKASRGEQLIRNVPNSQISNLSKSTQSTPLPSASTLPVKNKK